MNQQPVPSVRVEAESLDLRRTRGERAEVRGIAHDAKNVYVTYQLLRQEVVNEAGDKGWRNDGDGEIVVVDKATFTVARRVPVLEWPFDVVVDPHRGEIHVLHRKGERHYAGTPDAGRRPLLSLSVAEPHDPVATPVALEAASVSLAVNVARNRVYAADAYVGDFRTAEGHLRVIDGDSHQLDPGADVTLPPEAVAVTYDDATGAAYVALAYSSSSTTPGAKRPHWGVAVVDGVSEKLVREYALPHAHLPADVAVDPVRNRLYVLTTPYHDQASPSLDVLDLRTGDVVASLPTGSGAYGQVGTLPGGSLVYAVTGAGVLVISADTLEVLHTWTPTRPGQAPQTLAVDPLTGDCYVGDLARARLTRLRTVLTPS